MRPGTLISLGSLALVGVVILSQSTSGTKKRPAALSRAELRDLATRAGFTGDDIEHAVSIAIRESGGHPDAVNDTRGRTDLPKGTTNEYSIGLWQINTLSSPQWKDTWLKVPRNNAKAAYELFRKNGWRPWRLPNTEPEA